MISRLIIALTVLFSLSIVIGAHFQLNNREIMASFFLINLTAIICYTFNKRTLTVILFVLFTFSSLLYYKIHENRMNESRLNHLLGKKICIYTTINTMENNDGNFILNTKAELISCNKMEIAPRQNNTILIIGKENSTFKNLKCGDRVKVTGELCRIRGRVNPQLFNYEKSLSYLGIKYSLYIHKESQIQKSGKGKVNPFQYWAFFLKEKMQQVIFKNHSKEAASFVSGIVFGDKNNISENLRESFRNTGTFHILAASGMNIGMIIGFFLFISRISGTPKEFGYILSIPAIIIYTLMAGAQASIVRASVMSILYIVAFFLKKEVDILNILFLTAFIILLKNPFSLFDTGFQLSFTCVLGIAMFSSLYPLIRNKIPGYLHTICELLYISISVQIMLLPIIAYYFFSFSFISPLCNLLVVPVSGMVLYTGIIEGVLGNFSAPVSIPFKLINDAFAYYIINVVKFFSSMPLCSINIMRPDFISIIIYYLFVFTLYNIIKKGELPAILSKRMIQSAIVIILITVVFFRHSECEKLKIVFLDVGGGDAIWMRTPEGRNVLIDAGPSKKHYDTGEKIILPFLRAHSVKMLDFVILSHSHEDHYGGLKSLINGIKINKFIENSACDESRYLEFKKCLKEKKIETYSACRNDEIKFKSGVALKFIFPEKKHIITKNQNNESIVIKVIYKKISILLTGDLESEGENIIIQNHNNLRSNVIKIGHHGSNSSSIPSFIEKVKPDYAVISSGDENSREHPSEELLKRLNYGGIKVFRTDIDGAVTFTTDGRNMNFEKCRKTSE